MEENSIKWVLILALMASDLILWVCNFTLMGVV